MSEALRLAEYCDGWPGKVHEEVATELRRLAPMEAELQRTREELIETHRELAEASLKSEKGWSSYENANRLSKSLQEELAALRASLSEPVAWMTSESARSLPRGGNGSRGSVPVHAKKSHVAHIPLYAIKDTK